MSIFIIPIFIQHQGCPHRCVFCDQHSIAGGFTHNGLEAGAEEVRATIDEQLRWSRKRKDSRVEVAFYGGSFTGLPLTRQQELLGAVSPYLKTGLVDGIRLSTRPDYINDTIVDFLKVFGVTTVEIGVQSMESSALLASGRGHTAADVEKAFACLRTARLQCGAQLMVGLPAESTAGLVAGARKIAAMRPDFVRIYPTLVIAGSGLDHLCRSGKYLPLTLNRAVALVSRLKEIFDAAAIPVIRMGLQAAPDLEKSVVAGPYHPGFGEMVHSRLLFRKVRKVLADNGGRKRITLALAAADQSIFRGWRNMCRDRLVGLGLMDGVDLFFDPAQPRHTVLVSPRL